jgi:hypothetical protein
MDVCLLSVCCVFVRYRSLQRVDHSSRGVLLTVVCLYVWSRNLKNEEAKIRKWVVKASKSRRRVVMVCRWISGSRCIEEMYCLYKYVSRSQKRMDSFTLEEKASHSRGMDPQLYRLWNPKSSKNLCYINLMKAQILWHLWKLLK